MDNGFVGFIKGLNGWVKLGLALIAVVVSWTLLQARVGQLEREILDKVTKTEFVGMEKRLDRIESKLDTLLLTRGK